MLLLEAGGWDKSPLISLPMGAAQMARRHLFEWSDKSEPDPGLANRRMEIPHGKVIGGTSSINFMAVTRGNPADYGRWVAAGADGWSYADVLPFFKECETWEGGEDEWRGSSGPLGIKAPRPTDPIVGDFLSAAHRLGHDITPDYNGAQNEGFARLQYSLRHGRRSSSSAAFLKPALKRKNLMVLTEAHVARLLFDGRRVSGVAFLQHGVEKIARSRARTILCCGAINTPHLLMLSGIGPAATLQPLGIEPRVDLPVGKGLQDHLGTLLYWSRNKPGRFHGLMRMDRLAINAARAALFRNGPVADMPPSVVGFVRTRAGLTQPDIQFIIPSSSPMADPWFPGIRRAYDDGYMIRPQLIDQESSGEVLLTSPDYRERPRVIYNSLSHPDDLRSLMDGTRLALALGNSPELAAHRGQLVSPAGGLADDRAVEAFVRDTAIQLYHPGASCRMGNGPDAVLDADLGVRGITGLFVVDASAMPRLVSGNPNVAIMMMAARVAAKWRAQA